MSIESEPVHPVVALALGVRAAVKDVAGVEPTFMSAAEKERALLELSRAEAQLAAVRMRVVAVAEDVAVEHGARDVAAWLADSTLAERHQSAADCRLARELDRRWQHVGGALLTGAVSVAGARVIAAALDALPRGLPEEIIERAELTLVGYAAEFRPSQLARLGRRIVDIVAPEVAEAEEARRLRRDERRAAAKAYLHLRPRGDGSTRIAGLLPDSVAARLKTYLDAYTSPRHRRAAEGEQAIPDDRAPYGRRMAEAFASLLEHLDPQRLPDHGGDTTTVMVTIGLDQLRSDLAAAGLIDGDLSSGSNLTADEARRLACSAQIIPVVLGGKGEILDHGRAKRLFTAAQRRAMRLRDRECRAAGCSIPATWCEAHHLKPWALGGRTDLADGVLLCSWHHHRAHDPAYDMQRLPSGDYRFHRRT